MPQTSKDVQQIIDRWFPRKEHLPYETQDNHCMAYLESHGWKLTRLFEWEPPVPAHTVSYFEWICIKYLIEEWDFGGIIDHVGTFETKQPCQCTSCYTAWNTAAAKFRVRCFVDLT